MVNIDGYYLYFSIDVHIMSIGDNQGHVIGNTKRCFGSLFGSLVGSLVGARVRVVSVELLANPRRFLENIGEIR